MTQQIILNIIFTITGVLVTSSCGYLANKARNYHQALKNKCENEKLQNIALQNILQKQLTDVFFKYESKQQIPDYVYKNWLNLLKTYEQLGGNDYIHTLAKKIESWEIIKTDILQ